MGMRTLAPIQKQNNCLNLWCFCVCVYVHMTVHMCVHIFTLVHIWRLILNAFLNCSPTYFFERLSLAELGDGYPASLRYIPIPASPRVESQVCPIPLVLFFFSNVDFGGLNSVLMLAWWALYWVTFLPSEHLWWTPSALRAQSSVIWS